jgi:hypothetical protein
MPIACQASKCLLGRGFAQACLMTYIALKYLGRHTFPTEFPCRSCGIRT